MITIWFENTLTGQQWAVSDDNMIDRLRCDANYREIKDPTKKSESKTKATKTVKLKAEEPSAE